MLRLDPFSCFRRSLVVGALALLGCHTEGPEDPAAALELAPGDTIVLPGMQQTLHVEGLVASDVVWSSDGGSLVGDGASAVFVAPAVAGEYRVTATSRSSPALSDEAVIVVRGADAAELVRDADPAAGVSGRRGSVVFAAEPQGDRGARAVFTLESGGDNGEPTVLEVEILDETHGRLTFGGRTLDGEGVLGADEEETLRELAASELFPALALVPLDLACTGDVVEPRLMASLLMPWQAVQKYLTADRPTQTRAFADASICRYFTPVDAPPSDARPQPALPLLSNGRVLPAAHEHLPFDVEGAVADFTTTTTGFEPDQAVRSASGLATPFASLTADQNVYGPGGSMCRGACGADCPETNCGTPRQEWRCEQQDGKNTGYEQLWTIYTCGEHPGCIEHDACFDNCKLVFGPGSFEAFFCMRGCDQQAADGYGAAQGLEWAQGYGPYTHERSYEYSYGDPIPDFDGCPADLALVAVPSSGLAPHATVLKWTGFDPEGSGTEICRLDPGDGTGLITIDPCPASGEHAHTYAIPSAMREASGVYTATLERIGADITASTDVEAQWRFEVDPNVGEVPLVTTFSWDGFALVTKPLTCTLDFGDGSEPAVVPDCASKPGVVHTYETSGVYQAVLKVTGEDRPVEKTLTIEVKAESAPVDCSGIASIASWIGTASFGYSAAGSDGELSVTHDASGNVMATLTPFSQGPGGISFLASGLSGTVSLHELALDLSPNANNPEYDIAGNGTPVPPSSSADTGSNMILNVDLVNCEYNVHVQALVDVTVTNGDETSTGQAWATSFQSPWMPLPSTPTLSDAGPYAAHSILFILQQPELVEYYAVENFDLVDILGEAGLGAAQVSWQLQPSP